MNTYRIAPLIPAFVLVGFFFGMAPMLVLYAVSFVVAAGHAKELSVWKTGAILTALMFGLLYLALAATEI